MKVVILAGGLGSRISEESATKPKPMVEIGGRPILWHIMKIYSHFGLNDFVVCLGYKGACIKEFFSDYVRNMSDVRFDLKTNSVHFLNMAVEPWTVTLVDTGENSLTGGRLRRVREYVGEETFCMTYGDGLTDLDVSELIAFHRRHGGLATVTAVQPPGRFGAFTLAGHQTQIKKFREKPNGDGAWINGGFFVLEPGVMDFIDGDLTCWEREPMQRLAAAGELFAYRHSGFWQSMDTLRDRVVLENLWAESPPWRIWENGRCPEGSATPRSWRSATVGVG